MKENEVIVCKNVPLETIEKLTNNRLPKSVDRLMKTLIKKKESDWSKTLLLCPDEKFALDIIYQSKSKKLSLLIREFTEEDLQRNDQNLIIALGSNSVLDGKRRIKEISSEVFLAILEKSE